VVYNYDPSTREAEIGGCGIYSKTLTQNFFQKIIVHTTYLIFSLNNFFLVGVVFELLLCICNAGALPLDPHLQVHFALVILEMGVS
jgi:hypothetical protein